MLRKLKVKAISQTKVEGEEPEIREMDIEVRGKPLKFMILHYKDLPDFDYEFEQSERLKETFGDNVVVIHCEEGVAIEIYEEESL